MPPEFTIEQVRDLVARIAEHDVKLAIDTSGDALVASLAARPRLIKPNREELAELAGGSLRSIADVIDAANRVRELGVELVLVSLGADGAVLVSPSGVLVGESSDAKPRNTVGAGDCFLAGFLSKSRSTSRTGGCAARGLAWGAAAAVLPGTAVPGPATSTSQVSSWCGSQTWIGHSWPASNRQPSTNHQYEGVQPEMTAYTPTVTGTGPKAAVQRFGAFLAGMVMPNLGAFIAFGLITALFIPTGWINTIAGTTEDPLPITVQISTLVGPLIAS